jgi:cyclic pyranopterin phosphate synthase
MTTQPPLPLDRLGRRIHDLRISVTDRCNFRCTYCMPKELFGPDFAFLPHGEILSFEEIERLARIFVGLGVEKLRITGGEPLVRRDLARPLREAGLRRLTVSLDSLDDATFRAMNGVDFPVARVLDGIDAAVEAGFGGPDAPIKVNMVVRRGRNEESIVPMARWARERGFILRTIEYMDVGTANGWRLDEVVPAAEVIAAIDAALPLEPLPANYPGEVASRWRYRDGSGEVGAISSVTQPFCGSCTRARLSAEGTLYTCLFASGGTDLKGLLRGGADDAALTAAIAAVWRIRADRYSEIRSAATSGLPKVEMYAMGG